MTTQQTTTPTKKITLSTFKRFIRDNSGKLFINVKSSFDGMIDGCQSYSDGFKAATADKTESKNSSYYEATLGINGIWLVRGSRDYFRPFESDTMTGIDVSNSCGHFIIATLK